MPILDLGSWDQRQGLEPIASILVLGRMLFPDNTGRMEEFIAVVGEKAEREEPGNQDPLYRALDPFQFIHEDHRNHHGVITGHTLIAVRTIAENHPGAQASLNKAFFILSQDFMKQNAEAQRRLPANKRDFQKIWLRFKPVAHLWSALKLLEKELGDLDQAAEMLEDETGLQYFLAVAENMRIFGESYSLPRGGGPLLDPKITFRVPPDFPLPDIELKLPPLSEQGLSSLQSYQSPNKISTR